MDIEQTSSTFKIVLKAYDHDMMECKDIPIVQDNIVEQEEVFTVEITSAQSIPASIQNLLHLDTSPSVITIQDTSEFMIAIYKQIDSSHATWRLQ